MKKIMAICLMMVMVVCMSATALAAPGGFVSSPSGNSAPTVVDFDPKNDDCTGHLDITPYSEHSKLPSDQKDLIEKAYNEIAASGDLTKLNDALAKLAADMNISGQDLAVSDLFDLNITGCDNHNGHGGYGITLDADTLNHFVGLLYMNTDGKWELVNDAAVINNGEHLKFSVDSVGPFAIVVDTSKEATKSPQTGDNSMIYIYAIIMAASALAIIVIALKSRKQKV